ncbi:MAG: KTSC domain-containing protein [Bacteroidia bacterium]
MIKKRRIIGLLQKYSLKACVVGLGVTLFSGCGWRSCSEIPSNFESFDTAISAIEGSNFLVEESVNTSSSSFITDADYYSCDGAQGYLILEFKGESYLFEGVGIEVWEGFKSADSFGQYYHRHIQGRYRYHVQ